MTTQATLQATENGAIYLRVAKLFILSPEDVTDVRVGSFDADEDAFEVLVAFAGQYGITLDEENIFDEGANNFAADVPSDSLLVEWATAFSA